MGINEYTEIMVVIHNVFTSVVQNPHTIYDITMHDGGMIKTYLSELGFNPLEIKIFLTTIENGALTISDLSRKSGVERTALYRMLESLEKANLIQIREEHKRKLIYPSSIEDLNQLIGNHEAKLQLISSQKNDFLSHVQQLSGQTTSTKTEFHTGLESIKQLHWDMINRRKGTLYSVMNASFQEVFQMDFFTEWQKLPKTKPAKIVYSDQFLSSLKNSNIQKNHDLTDLEFYYVSPETYQTTQYFEVYDDNVIYYNWQDNEPSAVLIKNKNTAQSTKQLFNLLIRSSNSKPQLLTDLI